MKIAIIGDNYPPIKTSAASMLEDLAIEFRNKGHTPIIITPSSFQKENINISYQKEIKVMRVKCVDTKESNYFKRAIFEFLMPFLILIKLNKIKFFDEKLDGVIWYSPSIFYGPLIFCLKKRNKLPTYLILRDIFPEWAVDLGIIKRGFSYFVLKLFERFQYSVADVIGYQSPGNKQYIEKYRKKDTKIEVLYNWISKTTPEVCSIDINRTPLSGRKIFAYTGNMGIAQGLRNFIPAIEILNKTNKEIGFVLIGSGEDFHYISKQIELKKLKNILVFPEIPHNELSSLYNQCNYGIVSLDLRHKTHNIPGKFISYISNRLPVLALANEGNDLHEIIKYHKVGKSFFTFNKDVLKSAIEDIADDNFYSNEALNNCDKLTNEIFTSSRAFKQIESSLKNNMKNDKF